MHKAAPPRSLDEFLSSLDAQDTTVAAWARSKGFPARAVYSVISGHNTGRHGRARKILRAMGLKPPPVNPARDASSAALARA